MSHTNSNIDPYDFHAVNSKVKEFFNKKGLIECYTQNRLSILSACEDPNSLTEFEYVGKSWPMPQTNQMWLEHLIMELGPNVKGLQCTTTSYRQEKHPIPGRHDLIFPMFEFEIPEDLDGLIAFEKELLEHLGFGPKELYVEVEYEDMCKKYGVDTIEHEQEQLLWKDYGPVVFLKNFPERTSAFFNMRRDPITNLARKIDILVCGIETFGSAERSCNPEEMRKLFYTISDGEYANTLFTKFGKERVEKELEEFLSHKFFVRSGCGIGCTRLIRGMKIMNLI